MKIVKIEDVVKEAKELFEDGKSICEVSDILGIDYALAYTIYDEWFNFGL